MELLVKYARDEEMLIPEINFPCVARHLEHETTVLFTDENIGVCIGRGSVESEDEIGDYSEVWNNIYSGKWFITLETERY